MGMDITHFMWGYQRAFRVKQESTVKRIFQSLDKRFDPEIFLVGILTEERDDRFHACVEPEEDFWIQSEDFNNVTEISRSIVENYPEINLRHTDPIAQELQNDYLTKKSIRDAIKSIISEHQQKPPGMFYFVSSPSKVDCYLVSVVLGLQEKVFKSYYCLEKNKVAMHEYRNFDVPVSFIDATISEFLDKTSEELYKPKPGLDLRTVENEELLRSAGKRMMTGVVLRVNKNCIEGMSNFFRACNMISSLYYERTAGIGTIILAHKDHPAIEKKVEFESSINLYDYRAARKILELCCDDFVIHCDSESLFGLVTKREYNTKDENLFQINIRDHYHWELVHDNKTLMGVHYGQPYLPQTSIEIEKLRIDLPRIFKGITDEEVQRLVDLAQEAAKERHGTMLVISKNASKEAKRLKNQGILLTPCPLNDNLLRCLTPIDGAVLLSPDGVCHAIGTILDGKASDKGDSSRGSRFNSAVRYVESLTVPCLAIVVSEDGGVDLIPDHMPPIKRAEIENVITEFKLMSESQRISRRRYIKLVDWLDKHRFYLLKDHCEKINQIVRKIEKRFEKEDPSNLKVIRSKYLPNPEMDENLYLL